MDEPEFSMMFRNLDNQLYSVHVTKIGGGTVGQRYDGVWLADIHSPEWEELDIDFHCGTYKTHFEVAMAIYEWFHDKHSAE